MLTDQRKKKKRKHKHHKHKKDKVLEREDGKMERQERYVQIIQCLYAILFLVTNTIKCNVAGRGTRNINDLKRKGKLKTVHWMINRRERFRKMLV